MEIRSHNSEPSSENPPENLQADYIRHSKSTYATYRKLGAGENPAQAFDPEDQVLPDLSPEGRELARGEAEKFFAGLDPAKDALFFVSSNEARALETAALYRDIAKVKNFDIVKPENARSSISENHIDGDVRVIRALSLNLKNTVILNLFNPPASRYPVNFEGLNREDVEMYKGLERAIDADNKGSFAANFLQYGDLVKTYVPGFETAEDLYNRNFKHLIRLLRFAETKRPTGEQEKPIRIVAFGHENQVLVALNKYFEEQGINNCEVLHVELSPEGKVSGSFRDKTVDDIAA